MTGSTSLMPGAEPFFYPRGTVGCLLVHGFMSSPGEVRWLGQHLAEQNRTVCGVRLAGHGSDYHDMTRVRWQDWYGSLLDGYHLLKNHCSHIYVVGHSMGGTLALLAAADLPMDGVIVLAAPVQFTSRTLALAFLLRHVLHYVDGRDTSELPQRVRGEQAQRGEPVRGRIRYDTWSVHALAELVALAKAARAQLPRITVPACLMYATQDQTAPISNRELIAGQIRSKVIEVQTLYTSGHNLALDAECETVFQLTADFIWRHSQETGQ
ncbi:MAG: alpha/beta fold hydrolase [Anaerolineae bacterium]|nr:alpha/beta fold hydrolase [Anaerolineae bacterium]